ncbi:unnamed protein product [Ixodes pacificus]
MHLNTMEPTNFMQEWTFSSDADRGCWCVCTNKPVKAPPQNLLKTTMPLQRPTVSRLSIPCNKGRRAIVYLVQ